jgi:hypothetical protein
MVGCAYEERLMSNMAWRVRIDTVEGAPCGAGILVSADLVLTCAHVVGQLASVHVTFPGRAGQLPATVVWRGPWRRQGDRGDVALVELDSRVQDDPCEFAGLDALQPRGGHSSYELRALGFPRDHGDDGIHVTLHASVDRLLGQEWLQAEIEQPHLQRLDQGFSGAGLWLPESGQVAGMITDAILKGEGGYIGRMLPLTTIRQYWEGIDDLLPLPWMERRPREALRAAVDGAAVATSLRRVLETAFPAFQRPREFETPWAAIRYVGESMLGAHRLRLFLSKLTPCLDGNSRTRLVSWARCWAPDWTEVFEQARTPATSVVVTLRTPTRNGKTHVELSARALVDGAWASHAETLKVRRDRVQAGAEKLITSQVSQLYDPRWMLEFAVPQDDLGLPFDEWHFREPGAERPLPMRSVPLVVWDVARLDPRNFFASARTRQRWQTLRDRGKTLLELVNCEQAYGFEDFRSWLDADENMCALAYACSPKKEWLEAAVGVGIPVMVWSRRNCPGGASAHHAHEEFFRQITAALSTTRPDDLPVEVMRLRKQARSPEIGREDHHGRRLTLFRDDPARLPDPPLG